MEVATGEGLLAEGETLTGKSLFGVCINVSKLKLVLSRMCRCRS